MEQHSIMLHSSYGFSGPTPKKEPLAIIYTMLAS